MGAPAIIAARRRRIVTHFRSRNATSADTAVPYEPRLPIDRRLFQKLRAHGAVKQDNRGNFFLDEAELKAYARSRRRLAGKMIAGAAAVLGAVLALTR